MKLFALIGLAGDAKKHPENRQVSFTHLFFTIVP